MNHLHTEIKHYVSSDHFYHNVKEYMKQSSNTGVKFSVATLDINRFNYVNDLFGFETGDLILQKLKEHFSSCLKENEFFSRLHADIFAFCVFSIEYADAMKQFSILTDWNKILKDVLPAHYSMTASAGIIIVQDTSLPVSAILDKANYARQKAKNSITSSFRFYDDKMSAALKWQKIVTFSMESALENREFEMYLQPKVAIKSNHIVGAEALVRWNSPQYGMVPPDQFIPILEQNGFVRQLDFFMLGEACRFLKESVAKGVPQIPISVNFSKLHLATENLVDQIFHTVNQAGISTNMIEIEFTESISIESFERLVEVVSDLKLLGFRVSLDDFGSAYSSLNCLKELPIDIIKIDKGFLNSSSNTEKGKLIVTKVVELIKSLHMFSVMEGVETGEQIDFLRKLSCDFGQGYFYARPLPQAAYIEYLKKGDIISDIQNYLDECLEVEDKSYLYPIPQEFQMDNWELYTLGKNIDMGLMKGYLDGEATVQYVNDRVLEYLGYTRQEFREVFHNNILAFTHPDDVSIVQKNTEQLITTGKSLQFQIRAIRKDGKVIILQGRSSCIIDNQGRPIGLYAFQDVTKELERVETLKHSLMEKIKELETMVESERAAKEALRLSEERYRVIVEQSDDIMFDWDFTTDTIFFSEKYATLFGEDPICKNLSSNPEIRARIHPDDLPAFEGWITNTYEKNADSYQVEFRTANINGKYIWLRCCSTTIFDESGNALRALGLFTNINAQKNEWDVLTYKSQRDPLTKLLNKGEVHIQVQAALDASPNKFGAFFIIDIDNFKALNDNLGHQLGDTVLVEFAQKLNKVLPDNSIIGRIGGDELGAYLQGISYDEVCVQAEFLVQTLRVSYYGSTIKYNISASVGIACYPSHGKNFEELYHFADIALYESKRNGKDRYTIYHDQMTGSLHDNRTPVEWSERFLNSYFQGDFPFQIFEMLYETKDISASIPMILELLGKRFHVDRVYIFQNDLDPQFVSNTHEWCAKGIPSEKNNLQHLPYESLGAYLSQYSKEGVYCLPDIRTAAKEVYEICTPQNIKSLLHCAIFNEGVMAGFIGFDMCKDYHKWSGEEIAILGYLSRILSVFLLKSDITLELQTTYQNYVEMVENLSGFVYVVNPKTYQVLFVNNAVKSLGMDKGTACYKMAFGADSPCQNCPINQLNDTLNYATVEIYSEALHGWVSSSASKLKWEGTQDAVLICCTDISKYKNELS